MWYFNSEVKRLSSYAGSFRECPFKIGRKPNNRTKFAFLFLAVFSIATAICPPALGQKVQSQVVGDLTLAVATPVGVDLDIAYADSFSFRIPLNAGYLIYERADSQGVRHLCLSDYNQSGIDFELIVDLFPIDAQSPTSLDALARGLLYAGARAMAIDSKVVEISGRPGFDLTVKGIVYDRIVPQDEIRMVFLTDFDSGLTFTLIEHQHRPEDHANILDKILSTLIFTD